MIVDTLQGLLQSRYSNVFYKIADFVNNAHPAMAKGRHEILGNDIFALVSHYNSKPSSAGLMESHLKYVDVQVLLKGKEFIHYCPLIGLPENKPYSPENDIAFWDNPARSSAVLIEPGILGVFFPHDAHMPQIQVDESEPIIKIVIKIKASLFE